MKKFQNKKHYKKIMQSKHVLIVLGVCLIFFIFNIIQLTNKAIETRKNRNIAQNKINQFQQQKNDLEYKIQKLNTEKGMEENIRERFGLAKEGEGVVIIVEDKNKIENKEIENDKGFFSFLKNLFN